MERIGFIGMGNMARAIASGVVKRGAARAEDLYAYAPHYERLRAYADGLGCHAVQSAAEAVESAALIVVAVKPYLVEEVISSLRDALRGKAVLSVVAGYDLARYEALLDPSTRVQCVIPNTPALVGEGMTIFEENTTLTPEELSWVKGLFTAIGQVETVPARLMDAASTVAGCGPAFIAMAMEALMDAGVKYGLTRPVAGKLVGQMVRGSGSMLLDSGLHPGEIKDGVCSPGGSTIRGVEALELSGMRGAFLSAVRAAMER